MKSASIAFLCVAFAAPACGSDSGGNDPDAPVAIADAANGADSATGSADATNADDAAVADAATASDASATDAALIDDAATPDGPIAMIDAMPPDAMPPTFDATTSVPPTVFRADQVLLRDPHAYYPCNNDITDNPLFGVSANGLIADAISMDQDQPPDGYLDLSVVGVFRPLDQASATGNADVGTADCTDATTCAAGTPPPTPTTYTNVTTGQCLGLLPNTTDGYTPAITVPTDNCFYAEPVNLSLSFAGTVVSFTNVQVAAEYVGNPATELQDGLIRGFLSLTDAQNTLVPLPIVGDTPLSDLLRGGGNCGMASDLDDGPGCTQCGWWFYFNFHAVAVTWNSP